MNCRDHGVLWSNGGIDYAVAFRRDCTLSTNCFRGRPYENPLGQNSVQRRTRRVSLVDENGTNRPTTGWS